MIIPGRLVALRGIVQGLISTKHQAQPCGVDLTLKRLLAWKDSGVIDFDNTNRKAAETKEVPFSAALAQGAERLHVGPGAYLVEFNEAVDTPLDAMGQIFVRSTLFRSGALMSAGVMDSGYAGATGALLQVVNPHGLTLYKNAKLAQFVFHQMAEKVEGYSGVYQNKQKL